jgi:hypothetical protein
MMSPRVFATALTVALAAGVALTWWEERSYRRRLNQRREGASPGFTPFAGHIEH